MTSLRYFTAKRDTEVDILEPPMGEYFDFYTYILKVVYFKCRVQMLRYLSTNTVRKNKFRAEKCFLLYGKYIIPIRKI